MNPCFLRLGRRPAPLAVSMMILLVQLSGPPAFAANYYWDTDGATAGAGGASPHGTWGALGTTWSTDANGTLVTTSYTTTDADDLFFSAGTSATGSFLVTLEDSQVAKSVTFEEGAVMISGNGTGVLNLAGAGGVVGVRNGAAATIGNATATVVAGSTGLTKVGVGTLTLDSSAAQQFTGGLNVNGGTLALSYANLPTPSDFINPANAVSFGGGSLAVTASTLGNTSQTFGNITVNTGGGSLLVNPNGGGSTTVTLGALTTSASGGSWVVGRALNAGAGSLAITTTSDKDATGIYGGRVVFADGTSATGYDWATSSGAGPYTLGAYTGYAALDPAEGTDANNSRITASVTLGGNRTTNSLKFENPATAQTLNLGSFTLTIESGGLLMTGSSVVQGPRITGGNITAGISGSYNLVVHQYQATSHINRGVTGTNVALNPTISANIVDNGLNPVTLVKAGLGVLLLSGTNTFTGGVIVNGGTLALNSAGALNNNHLTFNANSTLYTPSASTTTGGIALNNGSQVMILNNNSSFTVNGAVTGDGGITVAQGGLGSVTLNLLSTANTFTGPIRYEHSQQNQSAHVTVASLVDSSAFGAGNISFGLPGNATASSHNFNYGATAMAPLVLSNRRFELGGSALLNQSINNNSSQPMLITSDLLTSGTGTKNLIFGGNGSGQSVFAGRIANGSLTTLNITKGGNSAGTNHWELSGNNTYNGVTTLTGATAASAVSMLTLSGDNIGMTGGVTINGNATSGAGGAVLNINFPTALGTGTLLFGGNPSTIGNTSGGPMTVITNNPQTWNQDFTYNSVSNLDLGTGPVLMGGNRNLTVSNPASTLTVGGPISGAFALIKRGAGTLALTGSSPYGGRTLIVGGTLTINSIADFGTDSAIGAPASGQSIQLGGGTPAPSLAYVGPAAATNRTVQIGDGTSANEGGGTILNNGTGPLTFTAPVFNSGVVGVTVTRNLSVGSLNGAEGEIQGVIQDNDIQGKVAVSKVNLGTWTLSGVNTYTGPTTITEGTLLVNGSISGSTAAVDGGVLGGIGTTGPISLNAAGTLAPGLSTGVLTSADATFNGGTFAIELNANVAGAGYDQLNVVGGVALNADSILTISLGFDPVEFVDRFTIINNDATDPIGGLGLFIHDGIPLVEGSLFEVGSQFFQITYTGGTDGNDVVLTAAVPEPGAAVTLLSGLGMLVVLRRRRRRAR